MEPPSIKIYSRAYTGQVGTVLTTHAVRDLPHPNHTLGRGRSRTEWVVSTVPNWPVYALSLIHIFPRRAALAASGCGIPVE